MKRIHTPAYLNPKSPEELFRQVAFHEAGHAVAIYLRNRQFCLPPVFFQITLDAYDSKPLDKKYMAKVEGGYLVENLSLSLIDLPQAQQSAYLAAFEADVVNLLIGPLAEAKYIALRDDESINRHLVNFNALHFYGGASDLALVNKYVACFMHDSEQRIKKIDNLLIAAYDFINNRRYWNSIAQLATYIVHCQKNIIPCEEIMQVIDRYLMPNLHPKVA